MCIVDTVITHKFFVKLIVFFSVQDEFLCEKFRCDGGVGVRKVDCGVFYFFM